MIAFRLVSESIYFKKLTYCSAFVLLVKNNFFLSCLIVFNKKIAWSFKTFSKILKINKNNFSVTLKLPSGLKKKAPYSEVYSEVFSQQKSNLKKKASSLYLLKKKPQVRGVAKNAVDHPNGGKGRSGLKQKKSPWGWSL